MGKIHLQIMLSDVGYGNLKRLAMFYMEAERENQALHRKMLTEFRKRFLEAHKNQLDKLLCS
jgi:hypothetical protein